MSSSLRVIVVCAALVTWLPAQAQFLGFGLETNVELTKQDLDIIRHTVKRSFRLARIEAVFDPAQTVRGA
jgi:hypothetical protein